MYMSIRSDEEDIDFSLREETLVITHEDLEVRNIMAVSFVTEDYKVDHMTYRPATTSDF
jgi:hypothetical protein